MGSRHHVFWAYLLVAQATVHGGIEDEYEVQNNAKETPGGRRFESEISEQYVKRGMLSATMFIHETFGQCPSYETKNVKKISLTILEHHSQEFEASGNEIKVSAEYIETYKGNDLVEDFIRRLYHAMTNIWQWTANGKIPSTLKEGIADFIVLKSGRAPEKWKYGEGERWDESSAVTALFLDYCQSHSQSHNFVAELNQKLKIYL